MRLLPTQLSQPLALYLWDAAFREHRSGPLGALTTPDSLRAVRAALPSS